MGESRTKRIAQGHTRSLKSAQKQNPGPLTPSQWQVPVNHAGLEGSEHPCHILTLVKQRSGSGANTAASESASAC